MDKKDPHKDLKEALIAGYSLDWFVAQFTIEVRKILKLPNIEKKAIELFSILIESARVFVDNFKEKI